MDSKISALPPLNQLSSDDRIPIVDVSDTNESPQGTTKYLTPTVLLAYINANSSDAVENSYLSITAMFADQVSQNSGNFQFVADATLDPTVTSGSAYYEYLGTTNGDLTDYRKLSDSESDLIIAGYGFTLSLEYLGDTVPATISASRFALITSGVNVVKAKFNTSYSSFLTAYASVFGTVKLFLKLHDRTKGITGIAEITAITFVDSLYYEVDLALGILDTTIDLNDKVEIVIDVSSLKSVEVADTGAVISLDKRSRLCNMAAVNTSAVFSVVQSTIVLDGFNVVLISRSTEPEVIIDTVTIAGSFVIGKDYKIQTIGTTDFTLIGAASNTIGENFTATGIGTGTGEASLKATKIKGSDFIVNTNMYLKVWNNGNRIEYWLEEI